MNKKIKLVVFLAILTILWPFLLIPLGVPDGVVGFIVSIGPIMIIIVGSALYHNDKKSIKENVKDFGQGVKDLTLGLVASILIGIALVALFYFGYKILQFIGGFFSFFIKQSPF